MDYVIIKTLLKVRFDVTVLLVLFLFMCVTQSRVNNVKGYQIDQMNLAFQKDLGIYIELIEPVNQTY